MQVHMCLKVAIGFEVFVADGAVSAVSPRRRVGQVDTPEIIVHFQ
jgi:hypothetical protein